MVRGHLIDLSQPLAANTPVYPGDPSVEITVLEVASEPTESAPRSLNNSRIAVGLHNGTHIDAPFHFFPDQATVDELALDQCCGPCVCLNLSETRQAGIIDAHDLVPHAPSVKGFDLVLLYTGWSNQWNEADYFEAHPVLTAAAARQLVDWGLRLVGVDFPSVDRPPFEAHLVLLGHGVVIVENLTNLSRVLDMPFELFAIPLPIQGRDASPVRAFARCH